MYRSFSDRVFGGVCGGIAVRLPLNAWFVRGAFLVLAGVSLGAFAVLYLMLWLAVPQESLAVRSEGGAFWLFVTVLLAGLVTANWVVYSGGEGLFFPLLLLMLSVVFFVEQVRRWVR